MKILLALLLLLLSLQSFSAPDVYLDHEEICGKIDFGHSAFDYRFITNNTKTDGARLSAPYLEDNYLLSSHLNVRVCLTNVRGTYYVPYDKTFEEEHQLWGIALSAKSRIIPDPGQELIINLPTNDCEAFISKIGASSTYYNMASLRGNLIIREKKIVTFVKVNPSKINGNIKYIFFQQEHTNEYSTLPVKLFKFSKYTSDEYYLIQNIWDHMGSGTIFIQTDTNHRYWINPNGQPYAVFNYADSNFFSEIVSRTGRDIFIGNKDDSDLSKLYLQDWVYQLPHTSTLNWNNINKNMCR